MLQTVQSQKWKSLAFSDEKAIDVHGEQVGEGPTRFREGTEIVILHLVMNQRIRKISTHVSASVNVSPVCNDAEKMKMWLWLFARD
jgi:hypothetical protein